MSLVLFNFKILKSLIIIGETYSPISGHFFLVHFRLYSGNFSFLASSEALICYFKLLKMFWLTESSTCSIIQYMKHLIHFILESLWCECGRQDLFKCPTSYSSPPSLLLLNTTKHSPLSSLRPLSCSVHRLPASPRGRPALVPGLPGRTRLPCLSFHAVHSSRLQAHIHTWAVSV